MVKTKVGLLWRWFLKVFDVFARALGVFSQQQDGYYSDTLQDSNVFHGSCWSQLHWQETRRHKKTTAYLHLARFFLSILPTIFQSLHQESAKDSTNAAASNGVQDPQKLHLGGLGGVKGHEAIGRFAGWIWSAKTAKMGEKKRVGLWKFLCAKLKSILGLGKNEVLFFFFSCWGFIKGLFLGHFSFISAQRVKKRTPRFGARLDMCFRLRPRCFLESRAVGPNLYLFTWVCLRWFFILGLTFWYLLGNILHFF